jgi:hypothetical protein
MNMELCEAIANIITDYREGEIFRPTANHVATWANQFPEPDQDLILQEMMHVLKKSYFTRQFVTGFLNELLNNQQLVNGTPSTFWNSVNFLNIQQRGNSQKEMLQQFDANLQSNFGFSLEDCGSPNGPFVYIDDASFSGNRVIQDLTPWIQSTAPDTCVVHIIVIAYHRGGQFYANRRINTIAQQAGKNITVQWWRCNEIEDRLTYLSQSDVLRPTVFPEDAALQQYINVLAEQGYPPQARTQINPQYQSPFFSSEQGRQTLEQSFLLSGVRIKQMCPFLPEAIRPLGFSVLKTLGFGSVIVTYRNCPNTCPPVFWADDPWYPLLPRKTN